jgi:hypothetical protein
MKIFVVGGSGVGKSPMARHLAEALGLPCLGASGWVRRRFPHDPDSFADRAAFVAAITGFAIDTLARDPRASIDDLAGRADLDAPCVIEGVRNPFDFVHLFDPRADAVVTLAHATPPVAITAFERGLEVIAGYLDWLAATGLGAAHRLDYRIERWRDGDPGAGPSLDGAIADAIARLRPLVTAPAVPTARVHAALALRAQVRGEYLHDLDPAYAGSLEPASIFAISSYPGQTPTFKARLGDGAVFCYLPPSALVDVALPGGAPLPRTSDLVLELADLVYHDCPDEQISVHRFDALAGPVLAWFKRRDLWLAGAYLFTVDWWTGNDLLHGIALGNGQLALLPNHKLKFGDHPPGFAPYRKLRRTWTVGRPEE